LPRHAGQLLRVLKVSEFERVGGGKTIMVKVAS
jgi:transcriptional regulator with GAF, ATPase, and Fis domain